MPSDRADVGALGLAVPAGLGGVVAGSTAGLLVAAIEVIVATAFASLVFAGPLAGHVPTGIGMALVGATLLLVVTSLLTSVPATIGSVQDSPVPILAGLLERITLTPGQCLFAERDEGGDVYYLERGTLTVELAAGDATVRLRTMRPGTFVGELAFYLGIARTATVTAGSEAELLRLPHAALRDLDRSDPALAARLHQLFAHLLSERLTDSVHTIEALLR